MGTSRQGKANRLELARMASGRGTTGLLCESGKKVGRGSALEQPAWEKAGSGQTGMQERGEHADRSLALQ